MAMVEMDTPIFMGQYRRGRPVRERCTPGMPGENQIGVKCSLQAKFGELTPLRQRGGGGFGHLLTLWQSQEGNINGKMFNM